MLVAVLTTFGTLAVCALAAYPLARMTFPGRDLIFAVIVGSMMVPSVITIVPLYLLMVDLGWLNSYQALIVPSLCSGFGVFLLRQFFRSMPSRARRRGAYRRRRFVADLHVAPPAAQ